MSSLQASIIKTYTCIRKNPSYSASGSRSRQCHVPIQTRRWFGSSSLQLSAKEVMSHQASTLPLLPVQKYRRLVPVGSFGGQVKSDSDGEGSGQKSLEKAVGSFDKELSVEDLLRKQMEKQDLYDDGGGGNIGGRPRGGGGGGGGKGGGGNFPDGEGFGEYFDEVLQVFLATSALLMLYIYIVNGEELGKLAQDYMKYLRTGKASYRLRLARYKWGMFFKSADKNEDPPDWLEREILVTPTWYDSPEKYRRILDPEAEEASKKKKKKKASPYREDDYEEEKEEEEEEEEEEEKEEEERTVEEEEEDEEASPYGEDDDY